MSALKVSDNFLSGTGVGESDAVPVGVSLYKQVASEENIDETMLVGSGIVLSGLVEAYEEKVNFNTVPGYVYLGDREFYMFGDKITQVTKGELSGIVEDGTSGIVLALRLKEFPDGVRPIYFEDIQSPGEEEEISYGASPIIVRMYPSGTLHDIGVPYDYAISSEEGINGVLGYRMRYDLDPSGTVVSGEVADFPWYMTPLSRFGKMYDPWRNDSLIPPDLYEYDFLTNSILIHPSGESFSSGQLNGEYVVEFEGKNEPFETGLDLSPLTTFPELAIVCLSPTGDNVTEEVGSLKLYTTKTRVKNERVTIVVEARSKTGNRLGDTDVDFYIERPNMTAGVTLPAILDGKPLYYGPYHAFDEITLPSADIIEDGAIIASDHRIDGKAYLRASGFLSGVPTNGEDLQEVGYRVSAKTDSMGFAHIVYTTPSGGVFSTQDIQIRAKAGDIETITGISLLSEAEDLLLGTDQYEYNTILYVSGIVPMGGLAMVPVISGCVSPSSMTACRVDDFVTTLASDLVPTMAQALSFEVIAGEPYVGFNLYESGVPLVVNYPMHINTTKLDGRSVYGR